MNKYKIVLAFTIIILCLVLVGIGFYLDKNSQNFSTTVVPTQIVAMPTPSPTIVQLVNTKTPVKSIPKLFYNLPFGWKTITDQSGSFEVGYDPKTSNAMQSNGVVIEFIPTDPRIVIRGRVSIALRDYDQGSRHRFLYKYLGFTPTSQDKMPGYEEREYLYNNKSCLFLLGIGYSQFPTTWGMCDAGNGQAYGITADGDNYKNTLQTIKRLR